jgi:outer membrane murein-binding lipoprotein Lpp
VTGADTPNDRECRSLFAGRCGVESIVVAVITGVTTLAGVVLSNSKSRSVMEVKLDALAEKVEKHNRLVERTYRLEQDVALVRNDVEALKKGKAV